MTDLAIVIPVYNDWDSLNKLIPKIDQALGAENFQVALFVIDDASFINGSIDVPKAEGLNKIKVIEVVEFNCNLRHQRAIAVGLCEVFSRGAFEAVIVMDSDGEDRPEDIPALIKQYRRNQDKIVVARRGKRSEGQLFQFGYIVYRFIFRALTGKRLTHLLQCPYERKQPLSTLYIIDMK